LTASDARAVLQDWRLMRFHQRFKRGIVERSKFCKQRIAALFIENCQWIGEPFGRCKKSFERGVIRV
jgi:hypothetical protein